MLDAGPEEAFDRVTRLAARLFGVPIALLGCADGERHWIKSHLGLDLDAPACDLAFELVDGDRVVLATGLGVDPRFADRPAGAGSGIGFFAAAPLITAEGQRVGMLCIMDRAARPEIGAEKLTQQLLTFSRDQQLRPQPVDFNRIVIGMDDLLHRTVGENIDVRKQLAPELWPAPVDPNQFETALLNLILNARDAGDRPLVHQRGDARRP